MWGHSFLVFDEIPKFLYFVLLRGSASTTSSIEGPHIKHGISGIQKCGGEISLYLKWDVYRYLYESFLRIRVNHTYFNIYLRENMMRAKTRDEIIEKLMAHKPGTNLAEMEKETIFKLVIEEWNKCNY